MEDTSKKSYNYVMLKIYVAHKLMIVGGDKARISVLNSLTDLIEDSIKAFAKDSERCDDLLAHKEPDLIQILAKLNSIGFDMDVLIEHHLARSLKPYPREQLLATNRRVKERVELYGFPKTENGCKNGNSRNASRSANRGLPIYYCTNVEDFLQLEPVWAMAKKDLKKMFNIEPYGPPLDYKDECKIL